MEKFFLYVDETCTLAEIIPEENPDLPGVAVEDRYTADFLAHCVQRTSDQMADESIKVGMVYDKESDTFSALPEPEPKPEPEPEPEPEQPTWTERIEALERENKTLQAQLDASIQSNQMLEDCLVEMAGVVYA